MLKLDKIVKIYEAGDTKVTALDKVSISFRENEFVSILGPSGCGKTTLLNIIGGLDHYTSGDLIINNVSTKKYRDADWDSYRNHSIGFVFQSYNLIPHQSVLSNVELALTLSGISGAERKKRATEALIKVGLKEQLKKKPNQLSGGQMQRVAIARALVNNPDILLADEPTGALDSETSTQVMELLAEIAHDKLVIMVTHNPELAMMYSTRIIRLLDGHILQDSMPVDETADPVADEEVSYSLPKEPLRYWSDSSEPGTASADQNKNTVSSTSTENAKPGSTVSGANKTKKDSKQSKQIRQKRPPKTSMKLHTALALSLNNLMTKKARTLLTAFAGSIGIIGISLILSLSNGVQLYIDKVEEDTLSSYPITIQKTTIDVTSFMSTMQSSMNEVEEHTDDRIYTTQIMTSFMDLMLKEVSENNLTDFKKYIEQNRDRFEPLTSDIQYSYSTPLNIYSSDVSNGLLQVKPSKVFSAFGAKGASSMMTNTDVWQRLLDNPELLKQQYEVVYGRMPEKYDELVLMISGNNEVTDYTLYSLGILDMDELTDAFRKIAMGQEASFPEPKSYSYDEIAGHTFKLMLNTDYFEQVDGKWIDRSDDSFYMLNKLNDALELKIVGILRSDSDAAMSNMAGTVGYRSDLMDYLIDQVNNSKIVKQQMDDPDRDVFSGIPFKKEDAAASMTMADIEMYLATLPVEEQSAYMGQIEQMRGYGMSDDKIIEAFASAIESMSTDATYEGNLKKLGVSNLDSPSLINIFPRDFESKDKITELIAEYNRDVDEEYQITFTDYVGLIMSSVTTIINAISYILIAFVAISLVVSSIMIGIITYISVLERTKEIGILRAIGASKKDISRVFNAETLIIGFTAGAMGILISELLLIPINMIIYHFTDISGIAVLPSMAAVILVLISMGLTLIAGLFPSRIAARKDPVVALRTE